MSKKKDNGEKDFDLMCKIAIISILGIVVLGVAAVITEIYIKGDADWYVPVKVVNGGGE